MKVTTVRFGSDLWALLESEAERVGVSVSQYLREAALARATAAAAARGEAPFELLAGGIRELAADHPDPKLRSAARDALAALARLTAADTLSSTEAVSAQSEQAHRTAESRRQRAAELRREAARLRDRDR
jgi:hypothetical protein